MDKKALGGCAGIIILIISLIFVAIVTVLSVVFYKNNTSPSYSPGSKIVIDHDGGADDAMAIFLALLYEEYFEGPTVVGLTTCYGNVDEDQVYINSQRILDIANRRNVPIYRGSKEALVQQVPSDYYFGYDGLGDLDNVQYEPIAAASEHAVLGLIDMSKKFEGDLTVVAIGPLTNIALAMRLDPDFITRLAHLYVANGNVYSEEFPNPEFNAEMDVEAYHIVAENSTPENVTFIPFSPFYQRHNISMEWRENVLGSINTTIMHYQNQFERISNKGKATWNFLDPKAIAMVFDESLVEEASCSNNSIILCGDNRGVNTNNFTDCSQANMKLAFPAQQEGFEAFFYDVFSAELRN